MSKRMFDRNAMATVLSNMEKDAKNKGFKQDETLWTPDKPEKGKTLIYRFRVLPTITKRGYQPAWAGYKTHFFKSLVTGKFVNEYCPTTIGNPCPICEYSGKLFNTGDPEDEKIAKKFYKAQKFVANILVVKEPDEKRKENEGKVFKYVFGTKIMEKFKSALFPEEGMEQVYFIDPYEGFDFNLVVKIVGDFANYDSSVFVTTKTAIAQSDKEIEKILNSTYDLETEFLSESNFKSYANLQEVVNTQIVGASPKSVVKTKPVSIPTTGPVEADDVPMSFNKGSEPEPEVNADEDDEFLKSLQRDLDSL